MFDDYSDGQLWVLMRAVQAALGHVEVAVATARNHAVYNQVEFSAAHDALVVRESEIYGEMHERGLVGRKS